MALPDYTAQDAATYKANIDATAADHENRLDTNESNITDKLDASRFPNVNANVPTTDEELSALNNLSASYALVTDANGYAAVSSASATEVSYLFGATPGVVLTTGDEGSGNGLDADTVDGKELTEVYELASSSNPQADGSIVVSTDAAEATWESIGPTGSGADNIWTALDSVPSDANWIEVRVRIFANNTTGSSVAGDVYARKTGTSTGNDARTHIGRAEISVGGASSVNVDTVAWPRIPISASNQFDVYWNATGDGVSAVLYLSGWGY